MCFETYGKVAPLSIEILAGEPTLAGIVMLPDKTHRRFCVALLASLIGCSISSSFASDGNALPDIRAVIAGTSRGTQSPFEQRILEAAREVYANKNFSPLWSHDNAATPQALALISILRNADRYGLRPQDYLQGISAEALTYAQPSRPSLPSGAEFDVTLSVTALRFLTHLHSGRVDPRAAGFDLAIARTPLDERALLERLATASSVEEIVASVEPPFYHYQLLRQALTHYKLLEAAAAASNSARPSVLTMAHRVRQIELTLERWRWLPEFTTPPIIVNIPQFRLFAFKSTADRKSEILQMDVIVGRTYRELQTPVFTADLKYIIFRPYWDVPYSITKRELLPAIRKNPDYLRREHLQIVNGASDFAPFVPATPENLSRLEAGALRLRQEPGPDNALGLIKFMLPNAHNVYLHATPTPQLFKQSRRTFSHGCIRVSEPVALASYVLRNSTGIWTTQMIADAMNGPTTRRVDLVTSIPVLILYGTALATEDGATLFFDDIYGHDAKLEKLLHLAPVAKGN